MSGFLGMMFQGGSGISPSDYIGYGGATTAKRITVYPWNTTTGFGTAYTTPTIAAEIHQVSFVPDNSNFSATMWVAPYFNIWQWSGLGFGTKYASPGSTLNPATNGPGNYSWTKNVDAFITTNNSGPSYPQAWAWSPSGGFGSKYANGSVLSSGRGATINGDSTLVAFQTYNSPFVVLFPWSSGFGTRYANPSVIPNTGAISGPPVEGGISFNAVTNDLACGSTLTPFIYTYPVTSAGFGTKYANPSSALTSAVNGLRFSPNGAVIATVNSGTPAVNAYQWGAGFGTKYADPAALPTYGYSVDWSSTTNAIATGQKTASPYTSVFAWDTGGFGAKYSDPGTAPGVAATVSFGNQSR